MLVPERVVAQSFPSSVLSFFGGPSAGSERGSHQCRAVRQVSAVQALLRGAGKGQIFLYVLLRFFMAELRIPMIVIDDSGIVAAYSGHRDRWSGRRHGLPDKLYDCLIRGAFQPPITSGRASALVDG